MQRAFPWWQVAPGLDFAPGRQLCLHSILAVFVSQACLDSTGRYVQSVYRRWGLRSRPSLHAEPPSCAAAARCRTLDAVTRRSCERGSGGETVGTAAPSPLSVAKGWFLVDSRLNLCDKADPSVKTEPGSPKRFSWG